MALHLTVDGDEGATHDLSATGLYFQSVRSYDLGATLDLVIDFSRTPGKHPLSCQGTVVRTSAAGDGFNIAVPLAKPLFRGSSL